MKQIIYKENTLENLNNILKENHVKKYFLVCGKSFSHLEIKKYFDDCKVNRIVFSDFKPNPKYEDVVKGVKIFNKEKCDFIIAVGGGSAIDVAKCIKMFSGMNPDICYLNQDFTENNLKILAIPTTSGTGSESTKFSVIYYKGVKQSIHQDSIIPNYVILDESVLSTLPIYQKKVTLLDSLCQAIESYWSVNSTDESKKLSKQAISLIYNNVSDYLNNIKIGNRNILQASNYSGQAINITQTTAPHAMSYKLTSLYDIPHGHAVALCLPKVWSFMNENVDKCCDKRGKEYIIKTFKELDDIMNKFNNILLNFELPKLKINNEDELDILVDSVNLERLKNNPVKLNHSDLKYIYNQI